jgi:A nuclease of the HNH/ENDO VII superfamily with conserved WHH
MASAATRAKSQARAAGKQPTEALCEKCLNKLDPGDNPFGTRSPTTGWGSGTKGDGPWTPDASTSYGKELLDWQKRNGEVPGTPIQFKDGFPDFSRYAKEKVPIHMTGDDYTDFKAAADKMRAKSPNWERPEGMTWHHHEDGVTMMLVPKEVNRVPHTGGAALSSVPGY